jgi:hypothetical protein
MNAALLTHLKADERRLIQRTTPAELARLDEDEAIELLDTVRRARNKARGQYRRPAARTVAGKGSRGLAASGNDKAALSLEAFEEALARVTRRVSTLARDSARQLKDERLAAARTGSAGPAASVSGPRSTGPSSTAPARKGARKPSAVKNRADIAARGARRQAKRDSR